MAEHRTWIGDLGEIVKLGYERMFLRDFVGYIVPGSAFLAGTGYLRSPFNSISGARPWASALSLLLDIGLLYIVGRALYAFGSHFPFVSTFRLLQPRRKENPQAADESRINDAIAVDRSGSDYARLRYERAILVKIISGNAVVTFLLLTLWHLLLPIAGRIPRLPSLIDPRTALMVPFAGLLAVAMWFDHRRAEEEQAAVATAVRQA
jgi:hypothetical protein